MDPAWQSLRWDLEELRVSMFAQELGTSRQVSAKRLARQLEALT
jgi:ATP-dependent helicase HrpA